MKPDQEPWSELDSFSEPPLAPGFALRVLQQARMQKRRRQVRHRLALLCVACAAVGFGATTLIRVRLAKTTASTALDRSAGRSAAAAQSDFNRSGRLAKRVESPDLENFISGRLRVDDSAFDNNAGTTHARGLGNPAVVGSSTAQGSQTLVIKVPPRSEESATAEPDDITPADPAQTSPHRQLPARPGAASSQQPSIHLP
jgi:hypothetical protein